MGLVGSPGVHGWHCDCDTCEDVDDAGWPFKVQYDSTVSGEVISRVFTTEEWDAALEAMNGLQEAAVETDAEPGLNAGIHVHVQRPSSRHRRGEAFLAFLIWESALERLAQGRFPHLRDGMNRSVTDDMFERLAERSIVGFYGDYSTVQDYARHLAQDVAGEREEIDHLADVHAAHDRHTNLSLTTRFNTWEFRLWNSSRSAWRMELACRMSVALTRPRLVDLLLSHDGPPRLTSLQRIIAEEWQGDDRLAALISRQVDYLDNRVHDTPAHFTAA